MSKGNGHFLAPDWVAVDWGTTHLRAWAMDAQGRPLAEAASDRGMSRLSPTDFEPALLELIEPWLSLGQLTVIACGMAGSRQGWAEAKYATVPCTPFADPGATRAPASDPRIRVFLLSGLSQPRPDDVMRGEETQIAGLLSKDPDFDGVVCLPGTHTKWARVSAGEVVSFQTFMTGELFALLTEKSVLTHSVTGQGWEEAAFEVAIGRALSDPHKLAAELFGIRARHLLRGADHAANKARLSGLLIGAELAGSRPYWLGHRIVLIGAEKLCDRYDSALSLQGALVERASGEDMTLRGLTAAYNRLKEHAN